MTAALRIALADDSVLFREGLAGLLTRRGHEVCAQLADAAQLRAWADGLTAADVPDVLIADVRMPPGMRDDGLVAALEVRGTHPGLAVLVLSQYVAVTHADRLLAEADRSAAGTGYLLKDRVSDVREFLDALSVVAGGGMVIDPEVAATLLRRSRGAGVERLSPRETEVLDLMARGRSNADIAAELVLSPAAVSKHVANIFLRLGLSPEQDNRRVRAILHYLRETGGLRDPEA